MKTLLKILSYLGLALTAIPSFFYFMEKITHNLTLHLMTVGMIVWFVTAPFWINAKVDKT